jgi:hypothetical protein
MMLLLRLLLLLLHPRRLHCCCCCCPSRCAASVIRIICEWCSSAQKEGVCVDFAACPLPLLPLLLCVRLECCVLCAAVCAAVCVAVCPMCAVGRPSRSLRRTGADQQKQTAHAAHTCTHTAHTHRRKGGEAEGHGKRRYFDSCGLCVFSELQPPPTPLFSHA